MDENTFLFNLKTTISTSTIGTSISIAIRTYTQLQIASKKPDSKHEIWNIFFLFFFFAILDGVR